MNWNGFIVGGLFGATLMAVVENYFLIARQQRLFTYAEQILGMGARLLALVPGKSAPRTDGTDAVPRAWWQRLIPKASPPAPVPPPDPGPPPAAGPPTEPRQWHVSAQPIPVPPAGEEEWRSRFTFATGED